MNNKNKENRSMYLYTALIFVMALLLILVAFFSQTNISKLGKRAEEFATATPLITEAPTTQPDELAKLANMAAELDTENKSLKSQLEISDTLFSALGYVKNAQISEAEAALQELDEATLSDNQKILFNELKIKINEGKEQ